MKEIIKKLEALGFTNYESKVFLVLMKGRSMSAAEVAEEAGIPRTSVYDILKLFAERGYCNEIETSTKLRYEIIDPKVIEDKIENELNRDFKGKLSELKNSFEYLKPLYSKGEVTEKTTDVEVIKGFNRQREFKLIELIRESTKEILLMNKLEGRISTEQDELVKSFLNKGGVLKSIYEKSKSIKIKVEDKWKDVSEEEMVRIYELFEKQGVKVRIAQKIPQFIMIFDRLKVFISLKDASGQKHPWIDVIIKDKNYGEAMHEFFEYLWEKSSGVKEYKKSLLVNSK
jgi:sugar-specific transcriptional regulator TrmB